MAFSIKMESAINLRRSFAFDISMSGFYIHKVTGNNYVCWKIGRNVDKRKPWKNDNCTQASTTPSPMLLYRGLMPRSASEGFTETQPKRIWLRRTSPREGNNIIIFASDSDIYYLLIAGSPNGDRETIRLGRSSVGFRAAGFPWRRLPWFSEIDRLYSPAPQSRCDSKLFLPFDLDALDALRF